MQADELRTAMAALEQHISSLRALVAEAELAQNDPEHDVLSVDIHFVSLVHAFHVYHVYQYL